MPTPITPPVEYPPFYSRKGIPLASAHKESPAFAACWPALQGFGWTCGNDVMSPEQVTSVSSDERHARLHMAYVFPPREGVIAPEAIFLFTDVNGAVTARFTHMALSPLARVAVTMLEINLGLCATKGQTAAARLLPDDPALAGLVRFHMPALTSLGWAHESSVMFEGPCEIVHLDGKDFGVVAQVVLTRLESRGVAQVLVCDNEAPRAFYTHEDLAVLASNLVSTWVQARAWVARWSAPSSTTVE